jgi:hypothetical protein
MSETRCPLLERADANGHGECGPASEVDRWVGPNECARCLAAGGYWKRR